jgi:hypothetical protein
MNAIKHIVSIALVAAAGTALAESPTAEPAFASTATRAQVQAELAAYRKAGVNPWSTTYNPLRSFQGTLTREQVAADYLASRNAVAATTGEDSGSAYFAQFAPRAQPGTTLAGEPAKAH